VFERTIVAAGEVLGAAPQRRSATTRKDNAPVNVPRLKRLLGAGLAVSALATLAITIAPAGAAPSGTVIMAAGSDTTEKLMDAVLDGTNEYNVYAIEPGAGKTVPGDANCDNTANHTAGNPNGSFNYIGRPPGTPAIALPNYESPQGSGAGRNSLKNSNSGANGLFPGSGGFGKGCVDIARSSGEPRPVDGTSNGDLATFEYYGFALDSVGWASPSLKAPSALTLLQLRGVYNCTFTDWSQVGGAAGHIQRVVPSASSGTGNTFDTKVLGFDPRTVPTSGSCPAVLTVEENHGDFLTDASKGGSGSLYQEMILPYSQGKWVNHANSPTNPTVDIRNGVRVGAIYLTDAPSPANPIYSVNWTGSRWFLNTAANAVSESNPNLTTPSTTSGVYPGVRYLYNVVNNPSPSYTAAEAIVGFSSPLCNNAKFTDILSAGFINLPSRDIDPGPGVTNRTCIVKNPS
jgi:ABC-type phosphate transport system substrate-binding protein